MKAFRRLLAATLLVLLFPLYTAFAEVEASYPEPTSNKYVNDYANLLGDSTEQKIISLGHELYTKTKAELVVVTMDSIPGKIDIETYANGLLREWGIGNKELNNGILLLVNIDPEDRAMRIEVGYGLEGRVPDSIAYRIQEEYVLPYFRQGDYDSGILNGYGALSTRVAQEYNVELSGGAAFVRPENSGSRRSSNLPLIIGLLLFLGFDGIFLRFRIVRFILYIMATSRHRGGGHGGFGGGSGGGFGGFGGGSSGGGGSTGRW